MTEASLNFPVPGSRRASSKSAPLQNMSRMPALSLLYPTIGLPSRNHTGWRCQILLSAFGALIGNVLLSYQTPDPDQAVSDFMRAVDSARKGWLRVHVSSYNTDKTGTLTRIKLRVEITTPLDFQFAPGFYPLPAPCKD